MRDAIEKILIGAMNAPSGENAQPWQFVIRENQLFIFNVPERDQSLYNFSQFGSFVAHGALIENIAIVASAMGLSADVELFPESKNDRLTARVTFSEGTTTIGSLAEYLPQRCTNRKPYARKPLSAEQRDAFIHEAAKISGASLKFTMDPASVRALGRVGSVNEQIVFSHRTLHQFLFSHITWTVEEAERNPIGFYIKTLELPGPTLLLKPMRHWNIVNFFNHVGLYKMIGKQNAATYGASAAIGIITTAEGRPRDFVTAGRAMQRVWLTATKLGLSFQPLTGVLFFMQRLMAGDQTAFSSEQKQIIHTSFEEIKNIFGVATETIPMMFRIGAGGEPSARSPKSPPEILSEFPA